jgi:flagellar assembly protein FliH
LSNRIKSEEIQIGNNYVLPIEQSGVTRQQAKVKKIIEETDAITKKMLDDAENKSQVIVGTASTEAERIIENSKKQAQADYDSIKQQAYDEGFQKGIQNGLEQFKQEAKKSLESLETLASSNFDIKKNIIDSATLDIVELVSAIADKVCHIKFDNEVLHKITVDAIKELNEKENITIIVNPQLVENISSYVEDIKDEITKLESVKIIEDNSVSPDGVIVETLSTRLDSRISTRIAEIARNMIMGANDELE